MKLFHWRYFLALEEDLIKLSRYVEFNEKNFSTFSLEMSHILLAATSEIDVVLKLLCSSFNRNAKKEGDYRKIIPRHINDFTKLKVELPRYELRFFPWKEWESNKTPSWWTAYNKVKHTRNKHYKKANLENVLNSLVGLFVSNLYIYKNLANSGKLEPWSQLFLLEEKYIEGYTPAEGGWSWIFRI